MTLGVQTTESFPMINRMWHGPVVFVEMELWIAHSSKFEDQMCHFLLSMRHPYNLIIRQKTDAYSSGSN